MMLLILGKPREIDRIGRVAVVVAQLGKYDGALVARKTSQSAILGVSKERAATVLLTPRGPNHVEGEFAMALHCVAGVSPDFQFPSMDDYARPGVYLLLHQGEVVYVGQAVDMRRRVGDHLGDARKVFDAARCIPCPVDKLLEVERRYILAFGPKLNQCALSVSIRDGFTAKVPITFVNARRPRSNKRQLMAV